jgi:hypothetical protein
MNNLPNCSKKCFEFHKTIFLYENEFLINTSDINMDSHVCIMHGL